jgi:hypothetical protein
VSAAPANATGATTTYTFTTHDSNSDPTFNQLLGINDQQVIAGYYGSGTPPTTHPNKGYVIDPPYGQGNYTAENFPGSQQTQVTAINDLGNTAGFWVNSAGANFGFVEQNGTFTSVTDPMTKSSPSFNQLLGRNNTGDAVGFYTDAKGHSHAYEYDVNTKVFVSITPPGAVSATATGINDQGDIVGFLTNGKQAMEGFLLKGGKYSEFEIDNSKQTMALGINDVLQIVGSYVDSSMNLHGFVKNAEGAVTSIDDPNGVGTTTVNGINNGGALVGFYTVGTVNHGFVAVPSPYPAS